MARLRLQAADRERLGCPEFLQLDLNTVTNKEAIALRKLGFPTPRALVRALQASDEGENQYEAWTAFVWLALKRADVDADPDVLEFALPVEVLTEEEPPESVDEPGKPEEVPEASTS